MIYYNSKGKILKKKGRVILKREDWFGKKCNHALYTDNKTVWLATDAIRPWKNGGTCSDKLCAKCGIHFIITNNGVALPKKKVLFDEWKCPRCGAVFFTR